MIVGSANKESRDGKNDTQIIQYTVHTYILYIVLCIV